MSTPYSKTRQGPTEKGIDVTENLNEKLVISKISWFRCCLILTALRFTSSNSQAIEGQQTGYFCATVANNHWYLQMYKPVDSKPSAASCCCPTTAITEPWRL